MYMYADRVMFFEVPANYDDLAEQLIEDAAKNLDGNELMIEAVLKNIKYLYSNYEVLTVDGEDYYRALSVMRTDNRLFTYYLNTESMDEKGLKMIVQINGILSYEDQVLLLEKDLSDIQRGRLKEKDFGFYNNSEKLLHQYIGIRNGSKKVTMALSIFNPGETFEDYDGMEYIVCELFGNGTVGVVTRNAIDIMKFGKSNNWIDSDRRSYLNGEFLDELKHKFGEDSIVTHKVDLLSLDGSDDYGYSFDKVSDMTLDRFRKYRKYIGGCHKSYGLSTPSNTTSSFDNLKIEYVDENNAVDSIRCGEMIGIRPFFILKSSVLVISV